MTALLVAVISQLKAFYGVELSILKLGRNISLTKAILTVDDLPWRAAL